ncbi:MAG: hypothetical protein JW754_03700 [Candidatus Aenigmarchaeota archaeon]|nr:hypothetical protein [Candidatus Aenigmarchaeota archaeon]
MIYSMGEISGFKDGISEEIEDVKPEEVTEDFLGEIRKLRKRKEETEKEDREENDEEREEKESGEKDLFKSIFGMDFEEWDRKSKDKKHDVLVYGNLFKNTKSDKSYQTQFTQNIMNYSSTSDMRADKNNYQHGVSTTYKQVSAYCMKRGRTRGMSMRGVGRK